MKTYTITLIVLLSAFVTSYGQSAMTVTASDVQNLPSFTTADNLLTLTPLIAGSPTGALFSDSASLIGVQGGNNANAVDMRDFRTPEAASDGIRFEFGNAGLHSLVFQWYSGDVQISGFTTDPVASGFDSGGTDSLRDIQFSEGTLNFRLEGNWTGTATLELENLMASANSTLTLTVVDDPEFYTQFVRTSITGISYAIPEPSSYAFIAGIAMLAVLLRRRMKSSR